MLLLIGIPSEGPLRLVIEAAETQGVPYVLLNQRESQFMDFYLEVKNGQISGYLRLREQDWPLEAFQGVYVRMMDYRALPENQLLDGSFTYQDRLAKSYLLHEILGEWLEIAECRVMNRNSAMGSNMSKPYQAQLITQAGFKTPLTLITNDPQEVRAFQRSQGQVIFKSISSVRSIVRPLGDIKMKDLGNVRNLPTQFQEQLHGTELRVHVVGDEIFTTEIQSEAVDYRYARRDDLDIEMKVVELPPEIAAHCFALSQRLQLPLCGIDLKRTPENEYYCFEVNPSPGYSYYQENTGQDIAAAIVRYLSHAEQKTGAPAVSK